MGQGTSSAASRNHLLCYLPMQKIAEDHVEQIFDIDGTGNPAEAAQGQPKIFGAQLGHGWTR